MGKAHTKEGSPRVGETEYAVYNYLTRPGDVMFVTSKSPDKAKYSNINIIEAKNEKVLEIFDPKKYMPMAPKFQQVITNMPRNEFERWQIVFSDMEAENLINKRVNDMKYSFIEWKKTSGHSARGNGEQYLSYDLDIGTHEFMGFKKPSDPGFRKSNGTASSKDSRGSVDLRGASNIVSGTLCLEFMGDNSAEIDFKSQMPNITVSSNNKKYNKRFGALCIVYNVDFEVQDGESKTFEIILCTDKLMFKKI